jgi:3',5'-cyclic AMP phosphodiesterase CpdA
LLADSFQTFEDNILSLYQSAVREVAIKIDERVRKDPRLARRLQRSASSELQEIATIIASREYSDIRGEAKSTSIGPAARDLTKLGIAQVCAELALRYVKALAKGDENAIKDLENESTTGTCDVAWLSTLTEYRRYFGNNGKLRPIPYVRARDVGTNTIAIKADARIALVGDWATGANPAFEVLKLIANDKPDALIHLGDIYYSGTPDECRENFADPINKILRREATVPVFTVSGNHDMYCGGVGFYQLIAELNPQPLTQAASFFCLRSVDERWQVLAMDTGLNDYNPRSVVDAVTFVDEDELAWHCDRIREFPGRTLLMSHHQLFSAFSPIGPKDNSGQRSPTNPLLLKAFQKMNSSGKVAAWFWGHEHTLSIYEPFGSLERGRCVGHGAVPVSARDAIYDKLDGLTDAPSIKGETRLATRRGVYNHGYALLSFRGYRCQAAYFQVTDNGLSLVHNEEIS